MDRMRIRGGRPLVGEIAISGAKNAALPLLATSLLTDEPLRLTNLPYLADIDAMTNLLAQHGTAIEDTKGNGDGRVVTLTSEKITNHCAPYDLVRKMRASILVLGPLLAREGRAEVSLPGGCAIGTRPVDIHLRGLELLGAEVELKDGYVHAQAPNGLSGAEIVFPKVSVGATENLLMAAALAQGQTRLINAAREPEVVDLGKCLIAMGATIDGLGSDTVTIQGASRLRGTTHRVVPDRIETGTYAMAAAITDGELELVGAQAEHLPNVVDLLEEAGVSIQENNRGLKVRRANGRLHGVDAMTEPYPGFPTDLQAQMMALMSLAEGASMITETIFENRFMHVPELARMGANVNVHGASALVRGREKLTGAPVMATDLRASVSLVLAGLAAEGETVINRVYHLDRGYDHIDEKLSACGAEIDRLAS